MTRILEGVRILEVAEHTFVPAASAALADLGAEVIKIEHVSRGDAMRGIGSTGVVNLGGDVHSLLEHSNRGKQSLGLDLTQADGLDVLYKLAATCDVFLTNKLPSVRTKLQIDVDQIRAANPDIIYVRGSGQGDRGPDADKGSYDSLGYWARAGVAMGLSQRDGDEYHNPPAPAFGDSIGAITIAGAIMGALFHREKHGHATVVDVSLLSTGMWSMGAAYALSLVMNMGWYAPPKEFAAMNPLTKVYKTSDGRWVSLTCLQAFKYWAPMCEIIERPDLITDERFATHEALMANAGAAIDILTEVFASFTVTEWRAKLEPFTGQWAIAQDTLEAADDPQVVANGYLQQATTAGGTPFRLVAVPMQYDDQPAVPTRAPDFNEHGDAILESIGLDWDTIVDLKVRNIVA